MIGNFHSRSGVRTSVIFHSSLKCPEMIQSKSEWKFPFILYFSTVMASLGYLVSLVTILIEETPARYNDLLSVVSLRLFGNTDWTRGWFIYFSSLTQWNSPIIWTLPTYIVFSGPFDPETPCHKWNIPEKRNGLEVPCPILNTQWTNNRGELDEPFPDSSSVLREVNPLLQLEQSDVVSCGPLVVLPVHQDLLHLERLDVIVVCVSWVWGEPSEEKTWTWIFDFVFKM